MSQMTPETLHNIRKAHKVEEPSTREAIANLFDNFSDFLIEKNVRYGDSALNPSNTFSKVSTEDQICNRLDDKLNRIKNSEELKKNDVADVFGYVALLMVKKGWLTFDELLD